MRIVQISVCECSPPQHTPGFLFCMLNFRARWNLPCIIMFYRWLDWAWQTQKQVLKLHSLLLLDKLNLLGVGGVQLLFQGLFWGHRTRNPFSYFLVVCTSPPHRPHFFGNFCPPSTPAPRDKNFILSIHSRALFLLNESQVMKQVFMLYDDVQ